MNDEFARLGALFLELRGRGVVLSHTDSEVLQAWQRAGLPPQSIEDILCAIAQEFHCQRRGFPSTLGSLRARVEVTLRSQSRHPPSQVDHELPEFIPDVRTHPGQDSGRLRTP